jgi:hypothetical protein
MTTQRRGALDAGHVQSADTPLTVHGYPCADENSIQVVEASKYGVSTATRSLTYWLSKVQGVGMTSWEVIGFVKMGFMG